MFRNYLAVALRNLLRNRLYSIINIVCLTVGLTAALLIALFVRDEFSYDKWIPGYEGVYRLAVTVQVPGQGPTRWEMSDLRFQVPMLKNSFSEVAAGARLLPELHGLRHADIEANETIVWADPEIFDVLAFPAIEGNLNTALQRPDAVVLTRSIARKYFGRDDVVGQTVEVDRKGVLEVTAVIEDLPTQSHLTLGILGSWQSPLGGAARARLAPTYLRLKQGSDTHAMAEAFPAWIDQTVPFPPNAQGPFMGKKPHDFFKLRLEPLAAIHLLPEAQITTPGFLMRPHGQRSLSAALSLTGVLILAVAVVNFVNLMTARAGRRAVEVGVRKVTGAFRRDLVVQFIGESFIYVLVAMTAALIIAKQLAPALGTFLQREIALGLERDVRLVGVVVALVVIMSILGGLYPAFVLSAFRPATVLKSGRIRPGGSERLRRALVVMQFAGLVGLILASVVIQRQTVFATGAGFHLETDQIAMIADGCGEVFRNRLAALPGVSGVSCADAAAVGKGQFLRFGNGLGVTVSVASVDANYLELLGLQPVAGRFFATDHPNEGKTTPKAVVINETAVRAFGFSSPQEAIGKPHPNCAGNGPPDELCDEIIGVVRDFPIYSVDRQIPSTIFVRDRPMTWGVVKLEGEQIGATLQAIDRAWEAQRPPRPIQREFYDQHVQETYLDLTRQTLAFRAFAATTIIIAGLGLFGLSAFMAESRTKEIGVRKALGAGKRDILRLLLWEFTKPVLWANVIAWPAGYFIMRRWLEGFAYRIDLAPWMFFTASAMALGIAIITVAGHALMVARARPGVALRYE